MPQEIKRGSLTTYEQYNIMVDFLEENRILLQGKTTINEREHINSLWQELTNKLNLTKGPKKPVEQWKRTFVELKSKVKAKTRANLTEMNQTGGGPKESKVLTGLEEKVLNLIGKITCEGDTCILEAGLPETIDILEDSPTPLFSKNTNDLNRKKTYFRKRTNTESFNDNINAFSSISLKTVDAIEGLTTAIVNVTAVNQELVDANRKLALSINNLAKRSRRF